MRLTAFVLGSLAVGSLAVVACSEESTSTPNPQPQIPLPDGSAPPASVCPTPTGAGTTHRTAALESDSAVWTAAGSPHLVEFPPTIEEGQKLTIEPCAVVRFSPRIGMLVEGELVAEGKANEPIVFERAGTEAWERFTVRKTGKARFAYATLDGGGHLNNNRIDTTAVVFLQGDPNLASGDLQELVRVDHVTVAGSASMGVYQSENGVLAADSTDLTITGSAGVPLKTWARGAGNIPSGAYAENADAHFIIEEGFGNSDIIGETTIRDRGLPYRIAGRGITVGSSDVPGTLTIEAGVTLEFSEKGQYLSLDAVTVNDPSMGTLRVLGTAEKRVTFTSASATPAPGDWVGIAFKGTPSANNQIAYATIAYAGADSRISSYDCYVKPDERGFGNNAAVIFYGDAPASAFITNTRFENSAQDAIVRGWTGEAIDFTGGGNTFSGISRCHQTFPKPASGSCPDPAPCPQ